VYTDEALSGAGADRPEFVRMLEDAGRIPRPFDALLLDDTSRISRNQGETARILDFDSQSEQADVLMTVHGLVDSLYIKELAKKTHRGLKGRALQGRHTGGRCFGYNNVGEQDGVRLRVNPTEAVIVRRIFEMAAEGASLKAIAKALNREGVASPRPRSGRKYATNKRMLLLFAQ
jgi:DNA invertase Pin-like site-specific DNA recombinase